jgi:hypothetical protein
METTPLAELTCVFDAYGTLFDVHLAVAKHRHRLGNTAGQGEWPIFWSSIAPKRYQAIK